MAEAEEVLISTDKAVKEIDSLTSAVDRSTGASEEHGETLLDTAKDMKIMGISVNSVSKGLKGTIGMLKNSVKGLKIFKVALAATGIGLIVVALGSLVAVMTRTQKGMNFVTKATNALKAIFNVLIDRVIKFGGGLIKLFSGKVKEGFADMTESFKGITAEIVEEVAITNELSDALALLEEHQIVNIELDAERRAEMKLLNKQAEDINLTLEQRLIASNKAVAVEKLRLQASQKLAKEELRIAAQEHAISESTNADDRKLAELRAKISQQQEEANERLTTQENKSNLLQQQIRTEEEAREQARLDAIEVERLAKVDAAAAEVLRAQGVRDEMQRIANQKADDAIAAAAREAEYEEGLAKEAIQREETLGQAKLAIINTSLNAIAQNLHRSSLAFKAISIIQALINAAVAVAKVIAQTGVAAVVAVPIALAAIAAAVLTIRNTVIPPPPRFAVGGFIEGPSHALGGVNINAEGGEGMINARSMAMPGVRAAASALNQRGGYGIKFQDGGIIPRGLDTDVGR
ncbi:hypothetical protein LCGC14_1936710, partial [marine sediment metagenome]